MTTNPWAWREGENPYRPTLFHILDLDVNLQGHGAIKDHVNERRKDTKIAPEGVPLFGELLEVDDVNGAEEKIKQTEERLLAELCTHRPRSVDFKVEDVSKKPSAISIPADHVTLTIDMRRVARLVPAPVREFSPLVRWS